MSDNTEARRLRTLKTAALAIGIRVAENGTVFRLYGQDDIPVAGARVTVDRGEAAKRLTATRIALTGPFALLMKKDTTRLYVTIEGANGGAMLRDIKAKKEGKARAFAALVNGRAGQ